MIPIQDIQQKYGTEIALVLLCCRVFLKTEKSLVLGSFIEQHPPDWQTVYELSKIHRIRPIVYETVIAADHLNAQFKQQLKQFFLNHSLHAFHCQQKATRMISLMKQHNIPVQLYKGIHLSQLLYNHLSIREFGDMDFIVREEDIPRLVSVLKENGYQIEGEELFTSFKEGYLARQKDVVCFADTPEGTFLYEFHYKLAGPYLSMNISFEDLLPPNWQIGDKFSGCDYLPLVTVNHGLTDLYPSLRCMMDIAVLIQKCTANQYYRLDQKLGGYYALNAYITKRLFNIDSSTLPFQRNQKLITSLGRKITHRLLKKKEAERIPTSAILKASFLLRNGVSEKLKLIKAAIKYMLTPNYQTAPAAQFKYRWRYMLFRPLRLWQYVKRHV
ncbi:MAG: nucleotidyltransferase family protein [Niabella sp.]